MTLISFTYCIFSAIRSSLRALFFCWLVVSFSRCKTEETWQTLVAIMLGKNLDVGGGKHTCSVFPPLEQHLLFQRLILDCSSVPRSHLTILFLTQTGHKCRIHLPDILMDLKLKDKRGGGDCFSGPNEKAFCTNTLRRIAIFHPLHLYVTALLHLPLHGKKKWPWM